MNGLLMTYQERFGIFAVSKAAESIHHVIKVQPANRGILHLSEQPHSLTDH